jgi:hypothetical protein
VEIVVHGERADYCAQSNARACRHRDVPPPSRNQTLERRTLPWSERRERAHAKALELTLQHFDLLTLRLDDTFQPAVGTSEESECADRVERRSELRLHEDKSRMVPLIVKRVKRSEEK